MLALEESFMTNGVSRRMTCEMIGGVGAGRWPPPSERSKQRSEGEALRSELERKVVEPLLRSLLRILAAIPAHQSQDDAVDDVRSMGLGWTVMASPKGRNRSATLARPLVLGVLKRCLTIVEDVGEAIVENRFSL